LRGHCQRGVLPVWLDFLPRGRKFYLRCCVSGFFFPPRRYFARAASRVRPPPVASAVPEGSIAAAVLKVSTPEVFKASIRAVFKVSIPAIFKASIPARPVARSNQDLQSTSASLPVTASPVLSGGPADTSSMGMEHRSTTRRWTTRYSTTLPPPIPLRSLLPPAIFQSSFPAGPPIPRLLPAPPSSIPEDGTNSVATV